MTFSTTIGDSQKTAVAAIVVAMPQSVVLAAAVADVADPINDTEVSGKKAGATIMYKSVGVYSLAIAQGSATTDTWIVVDGVNTVVTPA